MMIRLILAFALSIASVASAQDPAQDASLAAAHAHPVPAVIPADMALLRVYVDANCQGKLEGVDIKIDDKPVGNSKPGESGITEMVSIGNHHIQGASHSFWTFHFARLVWNTTQVVPATGYSQRLYCKGKGNPGSSDVAAVPATEILRHSGVWTLGGHYVINVMNGKNIVEKQAVTVVRVATFDEWLAEYHGQGLEPSPEQLTTSHLPSARFYEVTRDTK